MSASPQRKKLPVNPSLEHLQKQAKRRVKQTIGLQLAAAQHQLAQEYGCRAWADLVRMIESMSRRQEDIADLDQRYEAMPKAARVGDLEKVRQLLSAGDFTPHTLDQALAHVLWYGDESSWEARRGTADLLVEQGADPNGQYGSGGYGPIIFGTGECLQPDGLAYLIAAGADVTAPPIETKYGRQCMLSHVLGTYLRGANARKHRCIDLLIRAGAFVPVEITPAILAIHRGDVVALGAQLDINPALVRQRFTDLQSGNISLPGATLLHCAAEFGEDACIAELLERGADLNAPAEKIGGIGGQTPIFHAIGCAIDGDDATLLALLGPQTRPIFEGPGMKHAKIFATAAQRVDFSVRATFRRFGEAIAEPTPPIDFFLHLLRKADQQNLGRLERASKLLLTASPEGRRFRPMNQFTPLAQKVLTIALREARQRGHDHVDTGHLLLALTGLPDGESVRLLQEFGSTQEELRTALENEMPPPGTTPPDGAGDLPYRPAVKQALAIAGREAQAIGHTYVGSAHLLAGLLREREGVAARVLRAAGLDEERLRAAMVLLPDRAPTEWSEN